MGQRQSALRRRILAHLSQQHVHVVNAQLAYSTEWYAPMQRSARARTALIIREIERTQQDEERIEEEKQIRLGKIFSEMQQHLDRMAIRTRSNAHWKVIFESRIAFPCTTDPDTRLIFTHQSDVELFTQSASPILRLVEFISFQQDIEYDHKWRWMNGPTEDVQLRDDLRAMLLESSQLIDLLVSTITNEKEAQAMLHTAIGSLALQHVTPIMQRWNLNTLPVGCNSLLQILLSLEVHHVSFLPVLSLLQYDLDPTHVPSLPAHSCAHDHDDDAPMQPTSFVPRSALEWARDNIRDEVKNEREMWSHSQPPRLPPLPLDYNFSDPELMDVCTQLIAAPWFELRTRSSAILPIEALQRRAHFPHALLHAWKHRSRQVYGMISQAEVMISPLVDITAEYLDLDWR